MKIKDLYVVFPQVTDYADTDLTEAKPDVMLTFETHEDAADFYKNGSLRYGVNRSLTPFEESKLYSHLGINHNAVYLRLPDHRSSLTFDELTEFLDIRYLDKKNPDLSFYAGFWTPGLNNEETIRVSCQGKDKSQQLSWLLKHHSFNPQRSSRLESKIAESIEHLPEELSHEMTQTLIQRFEEYQFGITICLRNLESTPPSKLDLSTKREHDKRLEAMAVSVAETLLKLQMHALKAERKVQRVLYRNAEKTHQASVRSYSVFAGSVASSAEAAQPRKEEGGQKRFKKS